ncbi:pentapeptide repeat-containing protein [Rivibacter subsaxonicus]|uniref:Pentapeptide repeat protein n=1 Tax=Rivibacter subsaxonicus TaxID=457575 RepID=A0A4V2FSF8_9BURK|nr:pentapeptide repeat-containing protein [Rivibacter subsaxonicus]RZT93869.1 pentapeptide repeat protein [Rivibacter subsaxonicus]
MDLKDIGTLVTALGVLLGAVIGVLKYLSFRDKQLAAQTAFRTVVDSLSSSVEGQRLGGAILLRRFFDPKTELGEGRMPYAREAVDVIVALLRETEPGNFQKLLADGLLYAPSLEGADLQRTNLQNAYLGRKDGGKAPKLSRADFYRADLSAASLKGADASRAVFYQARLHNTIFRGADLREAMFFGADLLGAEFKGARLTGANFDHARNVPPQIAELVDKTGVYNGPEVFEASTQSRAADRPQIFLSKPGTLSVLQQEFVRQVTTFLDAEQIDVATVDRSDYPNVGAVSEVRRVLSGCSGALVLGFRQLEVSKGVWRAGTEEAREVEHVALPTTWNHVEAGMAAMAGLPTLFLVERGVIDGVFALGDVGHVITDVDLARPNHPEIRRRVAAWCNSVREAGPASTRHQPPGPPPDPNPLQQARS